MNMLFITTQISPSRKEVRIKLLDLPIAQQNPETKLNTNIEEKNNNNYNFNSFFCKYVICK